MQLQQFIHYLYTSIIRACFYVLYSYYSKQLWSICIDLKTNILGNFAFPDSTAIYAISFLSYTDIFLVGEIPEHHHLYSITIYDTYGQVLSYYDDLTIELNRDRKYMIEINNLSIPYACVIRIYPDEIKQPNFVLDTYLPIIIDSSGICLAPCMKRIATKQECIQNTNQFTWLYKTLLGLKRIPRNNQELLFTNFHITKMPVSLYFPNTRATYLMLHVHSKTDVIRITGLVPKYDIRGIRYFSYMICDGITTVTDDCVGTSEIDKRHNAVYNIYIASNHQAAYEKGYDKSKDALMIWSETTTYPVVVYREIRMDKDGIHTLTQENSIAYLKDTMGDYYPTVEIL